MTILFRFQWCSLSVCIHSKVRSYHTDANSSPLVPHISAVNRDSIGSNNGLLPIRRQAIIRTSAGLLPIGPLGTNFNEISIKIQTFLFMNIHLKISSATWRPFFAMGSWVKMLHYTGQPPYLERSGWLYCYRPVRFIRAPSYLIRHLGFSEYKVTWQV